MLISRKAFIIDYSDQLKYKQKDYISVIIKLLSKGFLKRKFT